MRHIQRLDFPYEPKPGWLSLLFLLLALAALAFTAYWAYQNQTALSHVLAEQTHVMNVAEGQKPAPAKTYTPAQTVAMDKIKTQLHYPWQYVFSPLEKVHFANIQLMTIDPDIATGKLKLLAQADDQQAMYDYIRAINGQYGVKQVDLISHQKVALTEQQKRLQQTQKRLRFELAIQLAEAQHAI